MNKKMTLSESLKRIDVKDLLKYINDNCKDELNITKLYYNLINVKHKEIEWSFIFEKTTDYDCLYDVSIYDIKDGLPNTDEIKYALDFLPLYIIGNYKLETTSSINETIKKLVSILYEISLSGQSNLEIFINNLKIFGFKNTIHKFLNLNNIHNK